MNAKFVSSLYQVRIKFDSKFDSKFDDKLFAFFFLKGGEKFTFLVRSRTFPHLPGPEIQVFKLRTSNLQILKLEIIFLPHLDVSKS